MYRCTLMLGVLLASLLLSACDRGSQLFEDAQQAESEGNLEEARANYLAIVRLLPDSRNSEESRSSFVRITLDMADQALEDGELDRASHLVRQAEPLHEGEEGRRVHALAADIRQALEERPDDEAAVVDAAAAVTAAAEAVTDAVAP